MRKVGVYILRCNNGRYYVGSTNDFDRRIAEHQNGFVTATRHVLPVAPVFFQEFGDITQARKAEYRLKAKKSRRIIEEIIRDGRIRFLE